MVRRRVNPSSARELLRPPADSAREYLRVSIDQSGRQRSNEEQHDDNQATWPQFTFGEPYRDTGSASRYAKGTRDDWPDLIADLKTGAFGAATLVLWEGSRGSRKVEEWVELIGLCEAAGVKVAITEMERVFDPSRPRDRHDLIDIANDAELESGKISMRNRRTTRAEAAKGRPHGRRLYGYRRLYHPDTGELLGQEPHPDEAPVVERIFADYLSGLSQYAIARRLKADGVPRPETNYRRRGDSQRRRIQAEWSDVAVSRVLDNRAYTGRRVFHGDVIEAGGWTPIIDDDTWQRTQARRKERSRAHEPGSTRLLSGIARCGKCNGRMRMGQQDSARTPDRVRRLYTCKTGFCVTRDLQRLDTWVTVRLLARMRSVDTDEHDDLEDPAIAAAKAEAARLRAELADAFASWRRRLDGGEGLSTQAYAAMEAELEPRIAAAEARGRVALVPLDIDLPADGDLERWWHKDLLPEQQRAVLQTWVVSITVHPVGRGRRNYDDAEFTEIHWRR